MNDVSPKLLEQLQTVFSEKTEQSKQLSNLLKKVADQTADFRDAQVCSKELGKLLAESFREVFTVESLPDGKLYYNIARDTVLPMLGENYELVNDVAAKVQRYLDEADGVHLNPRKPKKPTEKMQGILDDITVDGIDAHEAVKRLYDHTQNITETMFDDFCFENADFKYEAGFEPKVIRIYSSSESCAWCRGLAGVYDYGTVNTRGHDVWRRHNNCHCKIYYQNDRQQFTKVENTKRIKKK